MRILYLGNNRLGVRVLRWLATAFPPSGLVVHPEESARYRDELISASGLSPDRIRDAGAMSTDAGVRWIRELAPEYLVSVAYGYLLSPDILRIPTMAAINLHTGLLPYNRGRNPNVWSIIDRTPSGVTVHHMDPGADTGDIVAQRPVQVRPTDTGESLYQRLEDAAVALFQDTWPLIAAGAAPRRRQPSGGTSHRARDLQRTDRLDPDAVMRVADVIDILRSRTFPPYPGAYLDLPSGRVYIRISLSEEPRG